MPDFTFKIIKNIAVLSKDPSGWAKEINLISWSNREPTYDIRSWSADHTKMGKGISLSREEFEILQKTLID